MAAISNQRRLCIVNPFEHGGGAEYQIRCLIEELARQNRYDIYYLAHNAAVNVDRQHYRLMQIGASGRIPRLGYVTDAFPLYRALRKISPHVVYQRVAGGYTGICAYYCRTHAVPLVWHVSHDSDVARNPGLFGRNPLRRILDRLSIDYGVARASHIVTQTSDQARQLQRNYGRNATAVIPNFHPLPKEHVDKNGTATVLWVANIKPFKRPEVFVRLAAMLADLNEVRFVMIGSPASGRGDREWGARLETSIIQTPNLSYLGELTQAEVNGWLAKSHIFVNTSVQEGFPNTFIQAWMRAVPVVSLDVNPEQVLTAQGVGMCARTEPELASAVRKLLNNPGLRAQMGERARSFAFARHSLSNIGRLIRLLDLDLGERPPADEYALTEDGSTGTALLDTWKSW